jgi:hypothetical protein
MPDLVGEGTITQTRLAPVDAACGPFLDTDISD